jgi:hypothetical protein
LPVNVTLRVNGQFDPNAARYGRSTGMTSHHKAKGQINGFHCMFFPGVEKSGLSPKNWAARIKYFAASLFD